MIDRERALLALFLAPPLAGIFYVLVYSLTRWSVFSETFWSGFASDLAFVTIGIYIRMLLFGVAAYLLLRHFNLMSLASSVAAGILIPIALIFLPMLWDTPPDGNVTFNFSREGCHEIVDNVRSECGRWLLARDRVLSVTTGGFCGLCFWLIYTRVQSALGRR